MAHRGSVWEGTVRGRERGGPNGQRACRTVISPAAGDGRDLPEGCSPARCAASTWPVMDPGRPRRSWLGRRRGGDPWYRPCTHGCIGHGEKTTPGFARLGQDRGGGGLAADKRTLRKSVLN